MNETRVKTSSKTYRHIQLQMLACPVSGHLHWKERQSVVTKILRVDCFLIPVPSCFASGRCLEEKRSQTNLTPSRDESRWRMMSHCSVEPRRLGPRLVTSTFQCNNARRIVVCVCSLCGSWPHKLRISTLGGHGQVR